MPRLCTMATDHSRFASRTDKPMERRVREREREGGGGERNEVRIGRERL